MRGWSFFSAPRTRTVEGERAARVAIGRDSRRVVLLLLLVVVLNCSLLLVQRLEVLFLHPGEPLESSSLASLAPARLFLHAQVRLKRAGQAALARRQAWTLFMRETVHTAGRRLRGSHARCSGAVFVVAAEAPAA